MFFLHAQLHIIIDHSGKFEDIWRNNEGRVIYTRKCIQTDSMCDYIIHCFRGITTSVYKAQNLITE